MKNSRIHNYPAMQRRTSTISFRVKKFYPPWRFSRTLALRWLTAERVCVGVACMCEGTFNLAVMGSEPFTRGNHFFICTRTAASGRKDDR